MRSRTPGGKERRRKAAAAAAWLRRRSMTDPCRRERDQELSANKVAAQGGVRRDPLAVRLPGALCRDPPQPHAPGLLFDWTRTGARWRNSWIGRSRRRSPERRRILAVEADFAP